jgi:glycosyltransferase involved in cell wall biosynthesis
MLRVLLALPGLHRVVRGAEVAFEEMGRHLAMLTGVRVTLIGSGEARAGEPYEFVHAGCVARERFEGWPRVPALRSHYAYEELTFAANLLRVYRPGGFDVTVGCSYPYTNWVLRGRHVRGRRPVHVFVTQNGDWMCRAQSAEYKAFSCEGLVCTNPEYYGRNRERFPCVLIPNGVDPQRFAPGAGERGAFGLPSDAQVALMVSALIPSKRVLEGIEAVARVEGMHLAVAGDGELRQRVLEVGKRVLGERFHWLRVARQNMPELYRCADVFLHMSQDEPSANAYIEALASGLPIVTQDRAVTRWTLEQQAVLVDTGDMAAVARGLKQAMDIGKTDEAVAQRRALVQRRYTWGGIARQYAEFFEALCGGQRTFEEAAEVAR